MKWQKMCFVHNYEYKPLITDIGKIRRYTCRQLSSTGEADINAGCNSKLSTNVAVRVWYGVVESQLIYSLKL